jgi:hypothetical protein
MNFKEFVQSRSERNEWIQDERMGLEKAALDFCTMLECKEEEKKEAARHHAPIGGSSNPRRGRATHNTIL